MENVVESLKEFVWDIIGYLIPGAFLLIILNFCIKTDFIVKNDFLFDWKIFENSLIVIVSYVLGYVIYSLTKYKIFIQDKFIDLIVWLIPAGDYWFIRFIKNRHSGNWKEKFKNSELYKASLAKLLTEVPNIESMKVNEVRNILMSKNSNQSQIIYTFMFRASIFDHISTIFSIIVFIFILETITPLSLLKSEAQFNYIYLIMFLLIPLLGNSKRFFFPKAMRLPFSNF